ncbi:hypothetical protein LCGC14_2115960 [marine sediment metagenome]|uniref:Water stress and hypersensitive response domain-containing protein n=1 Tax=marine sediment metagenome TaxID=412755 RepID=A0A0F9E5Q8_9ZZZZ
MKNTLTAVRPGLTRAAFWLVLAGCLGGCSVRKPTLRLRDIEVVGMDFQQVLLMLDVAVTNPNDYQISLHGLDYTLTAGDKQFIAGSMPRPVTPLTAMQKTCFEGCLDSVVCPGTDAALGLVGANVCSSTKHAKTFFLNWRRDNVDADQQPLPDTASLSGRTCHAGTWTPGSPQ